MKDNILNVLKSKSLKPYLVIVGFSLGLLLTGVIFNSGLIGMLFGTAFATINPAGDPLFVLVLVFIYYIRKPYSVIIASIIFASLYQIYLSEWGLVEMRHQLGLSKLSYWNFGRIYGALVFISLLGLCEFIIQSMGKKVEQKYAPISDNESGMK